MNQNDFGAFAVSLTALNAIGSFLPDVASVALKPQTETEKQIIRESEFIRAFFMVSVATLTSLMMKSPWPFVIAATASGAMFITYEYALARGPGGADS